MALPEKNLPLIYYKTKEDYEAKMASMSSEELEEYNSFYLGFIEDTRELHSHGAIYKCNRSWDLNTVRNNATEFVTFAEMGDTVTINNQELGTITYKGVESNAFINIIISYKDGKSKRLECTLDSNGVSWYVEDIIDLSFVKTTNVVSTAATINTVVGRDGTGDIWVRNLVDSNGNIIAFPNGTEASISGSDYILQEQIEDLAEIREGAKARMINVTYDELVSLRDNGELKAGMQYRMTDYMTTTAQPDTKSAGHQFDIIVTADNESTLNEVARACLHEGDTYFSEAGTKLEAWQIWYCLDNDVEKFAWAQTSLYSPITNQKMIMVNDNDETYIYVRDSSFDSDGKCAWLYDSAGYNKSFIDYIKLGNESLDSSDIIYTDSEELEVGAELDMGGSSVVLANMSWSEGKGVIYRMIDEWNNDCPYDFKNIMFRRYQLNTPEALNDEPYTVQSVNNIQTQFTKGTLSYIWGGTSEGQDREWLGDSDTIYSTQTGEYKEFYTFSNIIDDVVTDKSITNNYCYSNVIKEDISSNKIKLNNIIFFNTSDTSRCYNNSFGNYCYNNSFGNGCSNNSFGNSCYDNSFGNYCTNNSFGDTCYSNSFGDTCYSNSFGNNCYSNSFGDTCSSNSFGNSCNNNSLGNGCQSNSFGDTCKNNTFGNYCYSNSFGNDCNTNSFEVDYAYNSFGNNCSRNTFGNNCSDNSFGNSCYYNSFGADCAYNSFGNNCYHNSFEVMCNNNSFGNYCYYNTFGNYCHYNSFGNRCYHNSFEVECTNNSFGNRCYYNSFGNSCTNNSLGNGCYYNRLLKSYTYYCHFDDGCQYINLTTSQTTSSNVKLQNVNVNRGVCGTSSSNRITINIENLNSEKEINVDNVNGYIYILEGPENVYKTTYENLVNLRDNSQLIPRLQYRIIDYITTTSQEHTQSAGHQFDVIVTAIDNHTLSEDAKATYSENDTYFEDNNANLSAWELKYCLDNDTNRFTWAGNSITTSEDIEVIESSNCTISVDYTYNEDEGLNEFDDRVRFVSMMIQDPSNDPYLEGNEIDEVAAYWGYDEDPYGVTCLTLRGLNLEFDEETREILSEDGISLDKWFYRGIIEVDGTEYDYWEKADPGASTGGNEIEYFNEPLYFLTNRIVNGSPSTVIITQETTIELNPKGVIYRMIDEWNNDVPYDFKNIILGEEQVIKASFAQYGDNFKGELQRDSEKDTTIDSIPYYAWKATKVQGPSVSTIFYSITEKMTLETVMYTISSNVVTEASTITLLSVEIVEITTFKDDLIGNSYGNIIRPFIDSGKNKINQIRFGNNCHFNFFEDDCNSNSFGDYCESNSFENRCYGNSFGSGCTNNSFGSGCYGNSFGDSCTSNSFGDYCEANSFVNYCNANSFGYDCRFNSFESSCNNNHFGNGCYGNSFKDGCSFNSFRGECHDNSFGHNCQSNSFGIDCRSISFGISANNLKTYYRNNSFGDRCQYINLANHETASSSDYVQNYKFAQGLQGSSFSRIIITAERNREYETKVAKNSAGEVKIYCEADLIA